MAETRIPDYKPSADKPPRGRTAKGKLPPDRPFKYTVPQLREALENGVGLISMAFAARGDLHCANIVIDGSADIVESYVWLAEKNAGVRRMLEVLCGTGGYMALVTSTLAVALPIAQHHNMYPAEWPTPLSVRNMVQGGTPDVPSMNGNGNGHAEATGE